jgi:hypothetical protein
MYPKIEGRDISVTEFCTLSMWVKVFCTFFYSTLRMWVLIFVPYACVRIGNGTVPYACAGIFLVDFSSQHFRAVFSRGLTETKQACFRFENTIRSALT